jgi:hypothetical protein
MNYEEIKKAIKDWSKVRSSPKKVIAYFKQGSCFKIERSQYEKWNANLPETLHVHMGIFDDRLKFILVDSVSDKDPSAHQDAFFVQDYLDGLAKAEAGFIDIAVDGGLSVVDALKTVMQWNVFVNSWVNETVHTTDGIFQAFYVPFADLKSQFDNSSHLQSVVFFGLHNNYKADLILFGLNANNGAQISAKMGCGAGIPVENAANPVPPFGS